MRADLKILAIFLSILLLLFVIWSQNSFSNELPSIKRCDENDIIERVCGIDATTKSNEFIGDKSITKFQEYADSIVAVNPDTLNISKGQYVKYTDLVDEIKNIFYSLSDKIEDPSKKSEYKRTLDGVSNLTYEKYKRLFSKYVDPATVNTYHLEFEHVLITPAALILPELTEETKAAMIAHELAHTSSNYGLMSYNVSGSNVEFILIDDRSKVYNESTIECFNSNYLPLKSDDLKRLQLFKQEEFPGACCSTEPNNVDEYLLNKMKIEQWMDFISSVAINDYIETIEDPKEKYEAAQNISNIHCENIGTPIADFHPSRITRILQINRQPNLRKALRCTGAPLEYGETKRACNLNGYVGNGDYLQ